MPKARGAKTILSDAESPSPRAKGPPQNTRTPSTRRGAPMRGFNSDDSASPPPSRSPSRKLQKEKSSTKGRLDDEFALAESPQLRTPKKSSKSGGKQRDRSPRSEASTRPGSDTLRSISPGPRGPFARGSNRQEGPEKNITSGPYAERLDQHKTVPYPARKLVWADHHESIGRGSISPRETAVDEEVGSENVWPIVEPKRQADLKPVGRFAGFTDKYIRSVEGSAAKRAMCHYSPDEDTRGNQPIDNSLLPAAGHVCQVGESAPYLRQIDCRDIMPTAAAEKECHTRTSSLHVDAYKWFRKPTNDDNPAPETLSPRGCEAKFVSREKKLENVAGHMRGAGAVVSNKGDDVSGGGVVVATDNDTYDTAPEKQFRKMMSNRKIVVPPGGNEHPDDPIKQLVTKEPSTPRRKLKLPSQGQQNTSESNLGPNCVPVYSPARRAVRQQGEITTHGFTEHTQRTRQRQFDINRYAGGDPDGAACFRPMRARASSCPPPPREAESGEDAAERSAGLLQTPREGCYNQKKPLLAPGRSTMASYLQYNPSELLMSTHDQRVKQETDFAQRCRDVIKVNTFAGRVAAAVKRTTHSSNSDGVFGCMQWN